MSSFSSSSKSVRGRVKLKAPYSKGQGKGAAVDPMITPIPASRYKEMIQTLSSQAMSSDTKHKVMQRAVSQCPAIPMDLLGRMVPSLLNSGSMVTLIHEGYFTKNTQPLLGKSSCKMAEAHSMFWLSAANNEVMPVSKYFEADITLLGFRIPWVGFLVVKDPNVLLEPQYSTQLLGVIGCNLIQLGCEEFGRLYGFDAFEEFHCLDNVHPVVFAQLCSHYHQSKLLDNPQAQVSNSSVQFSTSETSSSEAKKNFLIQVWITS